MTRETLPIQAGNWETLSQYLAGYASVISVKDPVYGAKGDSVTDDTNAINNAIAAASAAGGGTVYFPGVRFDTPSFFVAGQLNLASNVLMAGDGPYQSKIRFADSGTYGILAQGFTSNTQNLAANLNAGDQTGTVSDGTAYTVGDWVQFFSGSPLEGSWTTKVTVVAGNVLTLQEPSPCTFLTANTAQCRKLAPVSGCGIRDLGLSVAWSGGGTRTRLAGFLTCVDFSCERVICTFSGGNGPNSAAGIFGFNGRGGRVVNCTVDGMLCASSGSMAIRMTNITQAQVLGCATRNSVLGVAFEGCPWSIMSGNTCVGPTYSGAVTGRGGKVINQSTGTKVLGNTFDTFTASGLQIDDSADASIIGNAIRNTGNGGIIISGSATALARDCSIIGNELENVSLSGAGTAITVSAGAGAASTVTRHRVIGNTIKNVNTAGAVTSQHAIAATTSGNVITGNTIDGCGGDGIAAVIAASVQNLISGNIILSVGSGRFAINTLGAAGHTIGPNDYGALTVNLDPDDKVSRPASYVALTTTGGATVSIDTNAGDIFQVSANDTSAFTVNSPAPRYVGRITVIVLNNSGGVMGAITWGGSYKLAGAFTNPASTKRRTITFVSVDGTNFYEDGRAAADI